MRLTAQGTPGLKIRVPARLRDFHEATTAQILMEAFHAEHNGQPLSLNLSIFLLRI